MKANLKEVERYIRGTALRGVPYRKAPYHRVQFRAKTARGLEVARAPEITTAPSFTPTDGADQVAVVGGGLTSFESAVSGEVRRPLTNLLLIAHLAANAAAPDTDKNGKPIEVDLDAWYKKYVEVLVKVGKFVLGGPFKLGKFTTQEADLNVHDAILKVAEGFLGGAGALKLVTNALTALETSSGTSPWFTLFQRESQFGRVGRCQVSAATQADTGLVELSVMAFGLEAQSTLTQLLFFRFKTQKATLRRGTLKSTVDDVGLIELDPLLEKKLSDAGFGAGFIEELPLQA